MKVQLVSKNGCPFKVYNKDKSIKWSIKIFVLADYSNVCIFTTEPYFTINGKNCCRFNSWIVIIPTPL